MECSRLLKTEEAFPIDIMTLVKSDQPVMPSNWLFKSAIQGKDISNKYCVVVNLEVRNVSNAASCSLIRKSLAASDVLTYLVAIDDRYLARRRLWYQSDDGPMHAIFASIPQGSVLGKCDDIELIVIANQLDVDVEQQSVMLRLG